MLFIAGGGGGKRERGWHTGGATAFLTSRGQHDQVWRAFLGVEAVRNSFDLDLLLVFARGYLGRARVQV
jgi:hypothetical protein